MGGGEAPPPHLPSDKSYLPMVYYGLVIVATAAILLVIYNLIVIKWCSQQQPSQPQRRSPGFLRVAATGRFRRSNRDLLSSFKYQKDSSGGDPDQVNDTECSVCLSAFEEGEEVRQLPSCKHSFHVPCIDMWLYSHSDCPLCRAYVDLPKTCRGQNVAQEHSREDLLHYGMAV